MTAPPVEYAGEHRLVDAVLGYELLFRGTGDADRAVSADLDQATARVLVNTFLEFGLEDLVGSHLAFVNMTRPFLTGEYPLPFPPGQVVLEIIQSVDAARGPREGPPGRRGTRAGDRPAARGGRPRR